MNTDVVLKVPSLNESTSQAIDRNEGTTIISADRKIQNVYHASAPIHPNTANGNLNDRELLVVSPSKGNDEKRLFLLSLKDESQNVPRAFQIEAYNLLSLYEETCRNQAEGFQESQKFFEKIKKRVYEVVRAIYVEQLKIVVDLLQKPIGNRNFDAIPNDLKARIADLKKGFNQIYIEEIDQQKFYVEDGVNLKLTKEKALELKKECCDQLDQVFENPLNFVVIGSGTDLELLKKDLENKIKSKDEIYERLNKKDDFEKSLKELQKLANEIFVKRLSCFHLKADDLWTASELGDLEVLQNCLSKLWSINKYSRVNQLNDIGYAPIHLACYHDQLNVLRVLLENKGDSTLQDKFKYRPLHWAAKRGFIPCVELLLEYRADVNGLGQYGRTPLHMSVFNGHIEMTKYLLDKKANINAKTGKDDHCKTPLHDAVIHQDEQMVLCLTNYEQLDVNVTDALDFTPFYHAVFDGHLEIAMLIQDHKSWKDCKDKKNPNHLEKLLELKPKKGADTMIAYLKGLKKRLHGY